MNKNEDLLIDRDKRLILLKWLKEGVINGEELNGLQAESRGWRGLSMEEAREFIRKLEEDY